MSNDPTLPRPDVGPDASDEAPVTAPDAREEQAAPAAAMQAPTGEAMPETAAEAASEEASNTVPEGALEVEASDVDLRGVVGEAAVRRAPKYKAFLWAGAIVGLAAGLFFGGDILRDPASRSIDKPGVLFSVILIGGVALGLLVAGAIATVLDRRSVRRSESRTTRDV